MKNKTFNETKAAYFFCCTGPTDPNFWQIKIMILISHVNISFSLLCIFLLILSFSLDDNKIHKKQKFSALDIFESLSMWSVSCVNCVEIRTIFFNSIINIFVFRCADPEI